jgi:glycosyltransferase involved in cell wall biosynthesis
VKFSLIIPTKGRDEELVRAIASVLEQSVRDIEVIVSDQNSDDRVPRLLAARGWTERVIHLRSSAGASRARNEGIARATGEILGFPDDDCVYPPGLLESIADFFEAHPNYGILTGRSYADDGQDAAARHGKGAAEISRYAIYRQAIEFAIWIRREQLGPLRFDENLGTGSVTPWQADEGPDLVLRLGERGVKGRYDPAFAVWHPRPDLNDPRTLSRSYRYACGSGFFLRKHRYPFPFFLYLLARAVAGSIVSLLRLRLPLARSHWARVRGLCRGWRGFAG